MKPTDELKSEHRIIGKALSGLTRAAQALEGGVDVPANWFREELDFIKTFADNCHNRKEETVLFPMLENRFAETANDPVPEMLKQHRAERQMLKNLEKAIDKFADGDKSQASEISRLSWKYRVFLIKHMREENTMLTRFVEKKLPADIKLEVAERFSVVEDQLGPDYHEKAAILAEKLRDQGRRMAA